MTVTPAYGRDFKTAKEAQASWDAGQDFIVQDVMSPSCGRAINRNDVREFKIAERITIRFSNLRKVLVLK